MEKGDDNYDVVIVGAGISGINFAYRLQERCPELSYVILEGRHEIGGTWSLFTYPGIRSDSDLYTFGFPWRPWTHKTAIAKGDLIMSYMRESAAAAGIDRHIRFRHRVDEARFASESGTWTFDVTADGAEKKTLRSRFFMMCTGYYRYDEALQTDVPGIDSFQGRVVHPQFWPADLDYTDKRVVIIGSGATAVTMVPAMADKAQHVTMLQRSPSYLLSTPSEGTFERAIRHVFPPRWQHRLIRWKWLLVGHVFVAFCLWFPRRARAYVRAATRKELPPGMSIDPAFNPAYTPFQQRLCFCPDADFYAALRAGTASVETGTIAAVSARGIRLHSGRELPADIIATATGLALQVGGGVRLRVDGAPTTPAGRFVWNGALLDGIPNLAFVVGYVDASWTLGADATALLVCRLLRRMRADGARLLVPRMPPADRAVVRDRPFLRLSSTYIQRSSDLLPKHGDRAPWRPRRWYVVDLWTAWFADLGRAMQWTR